jgi:hypothetical protein
MTLGTVLEYHFVDVAVVIVEVGMAVGTVMIVGIFGHHED